MTFLSTNVLCRQYCPLQIFQTCVTQEQPSNSFDSSNHECDTFKCSGLVSETLPRSFSQITNTTRIVARDTIPESLSSTDRVPAHPYPTSSPISNSQSQGIPLTLILPTFPLPLPSEAMTTPPLISTSTQTVTSTPLQGHGDAISPNSCCVSLVVSLSFTLHYCFKKLLFG